MTDPGIGQRAERLRQDFSTWWGTVETRSSSRSQHGRSLQNELRFDPDFDHMPQGGIDVVLYATKSDTPILNNRICTAPIAITRLTDTSRVQNLYAVDFDEELEVSMSDADEVGFDSAESGFPCRGLFGEEVLIHRIVGSGMYETIISTIEIESLRDWESGEILQMESIEELELIRSGSRGQRTEPTTVPSRDSLSDGVIVISPDRACGIGADPFNTWKRIRSIIDHITQEETGIKRFLDCRKSGPVGVDVREDEDLHERSAKYCPIVDGRIC